MDIYEIQYNGYEDEGVYGISIVDIPANDMKFVAMRGESKVVLLESDKEKRVLTGVVLVPDQQIYRVEDNYEYNIVFRKDVIELLSQDFLKRGFVKNSKYNHEGKWLEGISVIESWVVYNSDNDKSNALGMNVPVGTWLVSMKLSQELWDEYVKTGKVTGFSIDAFLEHKKVKMKKNKNTIMGLLNKFIKMLKQVNLQEVVIDGNTLFSDDFEIGSDVMIEVEGEVKPLVSTSFEYEGFLLTTDENGFITSKDPIEQTEPESQEVQVEAVSEEVIDETIEVADEIITAVEEGDVVVVEDKIAELEEVINQLKIENEELKKKYEDLSKKPAALKLKANNVTQSSNGKETILDLLKKYK